MAFWGESLIKGQSREPKRKYRWKVQFGTSVGMDKGEGLIWYAKTVDKPKMTISADANHKFMGHTFKFPGSVTWEDINIVLVDPAENQGIDAARKLLEMVAASGYEFPKKSNNLATINKVESVSALGPVTITQLDAEGNDIEEWTLFNPFIKSVEWDQLDYASDDLSEITLGVVYDWAELTRGVAGQINPTISTVSRE